EALTEDLDLSSRLAAATGIRVAWAIDAEVWEEPVDALAALWRQRVRWAEGAIRRVLEHGPAVVRSPLLRIAARADFVGYAGPVRQDGPWRGRRVAAGRGLGADRREPRTGDGRPLAMSRVAVIFTGGTISMETDSTAGGNVPRLNGAAILARTPGLDEVADVV